MKKLISLEKRVTQLLTKYKSLRNDNRKVCVKIWEEQLKERSDITTNFFAMYSQGKYITADNITRIIRKVKEHNPELRGTNHESNLKKMNAAKKLFKK